MYVEGGLSAITDALYVSADHLSKNGERFEGYKPALIVITDGGEENSYYRMERVLLLLGEKIRVYAVGFPQALERQGLKVQERAKNYLIKLVEQSHGRAYFPETSSEVKSVANRMLSDIRSN